MPHDAQTYATGVKQWTSPAETEAANAAVVAAAQVEYESSEDQAEFDYRTLTGVPRVNPVITEVAPSSLEVSPEATSTKKHIGITGTDFYFGSKVLWDDEVISGEVILGEGVAEILILVPWATVAGDVEVKVTNGDGFESAASTFTWTAIAPLAAEPQAKKATAKKK